MAKIKNNIEFHEDYAVIVGGGKYGGSLLLTLRMHKEFYSTNGTSQHWEMFNQELMEK